MKITATTHQGATVEQVISQDTYADVCAFITCSDYIISYADRLRIAQWELENFHKANIPFFVHHSQVSTLKWWISNHVHGYDCQIYIYAGGAEHPNETPSGAVKIIKEEEITCKSPS